MVRITLTLNLIFTLKYPLRLVGLINQSQIPTEHCKIRQPCMVMDLTAPYPIGYL